MGDPRDSLCNVRTPADASCHRCFDASQASEVAAGHGRVPSPRSALPWRCRFPAWPQRVLRTLAPPVGADPAATQSAAPSLAALPIATAEEPAGPVATIQPEAIEDEGAASPEVPAEVSPPAEDSSAGEEPGIATEQPVLQEPEDATSEPEPAPEPSPDQPGTETENWAGQAGPGDALLPDIGAFSLATTTCSYATGGTAAYTNTLCWLDMEGLTTEYVNRGTAQNPNWQSILGDEYTVPGSSGSVPAPGAGYYGELQNVPITVS